MLVMLALTLPLQVLTPVWHVEQAHTQLQQLQQLPLSVCSVMQVPTPLPWEQLYQEPVPGTYSNNSGTATCTLCEAGRYKLYYPTGLLRLDRSCGTGGTDVCGVSQSSTLGPSYVATNALDGNKNTFTHTNDADPLWTLDCGVTRQVKSGSEVKSGTI